MNILANTLKEYTNLTFTENGALTYRSSTNAVVDFFFFGGAMRSATDERIVDTFDNAMAEDPELAMRVAQWIRDRDEGAGERRVWRVILRRIEERYPQYLPMAIIRSVELGRWDDVLHFENPTTREAVCDFVAQALGNGDRLCAKWMPRPNKKWITANGRGRKVANEIRKHMGLSARDYRKLLVSLSETVEQKMCAGDWEGIELSAVPSVAAARYKKAFHRHIPHKYQSFNKDVIEGKATMNASVTYPHDVYRAMKNGATRDSVQAHWLSLPNFLGDASILPICDVSGSMTWSSATPTPIDVSVSLGLYLSERNRGPFQDYIMTFDDDPEFFHLRGDLYQRAKQLERAPWGGSTNVEAAFKKLLSFAKMSRASQEDLPNTLLVISDMEFNAASSGRTIADTVRHEYALAGYKLPNVVWWNVNSRSSNVPVKVNAQGFGLISGYSPAIMTAVLGGEITPEKIMMRAIDKDRYSVFTFD